MYVLLFLNTVMMSMQLVKPDLSTTEKQNITISWQIF